MPKSILVADDDETMLDLYARMFLKTGYSISRASSFEEAVGLIDANTYDLLITDLMFPDRLGDRLVKHFEKKRPGARALIVTGAVSELSPKNSPRVYLQKPFDYDVFMGEVTRALEN
ncbi:MAG TPA: hypothetical protein DCZ92_15020 [Elusimicrobia bacterium]|nr:MAG: hypothetical protein A2016_10335 [Elusimicrobia bacterium GWF2_62_30]HBA62095.1 hypothetical protein [Elusimicrobiota bacterium]